MISRCLPRLYCEMWWGQDVPGILFLGNLYLGSNDHRSTPLLIVNKDVFPILSLLPTSPLLKLPCPKTLTHSVKAWWTVFPCSDCQHRSQCLSSCWSYPLYRSIWKSYFGKRGWYKKSYNSCSSFVVYLVGFSSITLHTLTLVQHCPSELSHTSHEPSRNPCQHQNLSFLELYLATIGYSKSTFLFVPYHSCVGLHLLNVSPELEDSESWTEG